MSGTGFSGARLGRMYDVMAGHGERGDVPGIVTLVSRRDDLAATPGRYGWDGGYGTSWYVNPKEGLVGILMTQRVLDAPAAPAVLLGFLTLAYGALDD